MRSVVANSYAGCDNEGMATKRQSPSVPDDKESSIHVGVPVSVRLQQHQLQWATAQGEGRGLSVGAVARELISDAMHWYGLPSEAATLLEADWVARGQNRREYMKNLLNRRYTELVIAKAQADAKEKTPPSK